MYVVASRTTVRISTAIAITLGNYMLLNDEGQSEEACSYLGTVGSVGNKKEKNGQSLSYSEMHMDRRGFCPSPVCEKLTNIIYYQFVIT